jgi:hypothetical protein
MSSHELFEQFNRFLIRLTLLIILIIGLIRIVVPEIISLRQVFTGEQQRNERVESPAEIQGR